MLWILSVLCCKFHALYRCEKDYVTKLQLTRQNDTSQGSGNEVIADYKAVPFSGQGVVFRLNFADV